MMRYLKVLMVLSSLPLQVMCTQHTVGSSVVKLSGGMPADERFSSVLVFPSLKCLGTPIGPHLIMTAAHCVARYSTEDGMIVTQPSGEISKRLRYLRPALPKSDPDRIGVLNVERIEVAKPYLQAAELLHQYAIKHNKNYSSDQFLTILATIDRVEDVALLHIHESIPNLDHYEVQPTEASRSEPFMLIGPVTDKKGSDLGMYGDSLAIAEKLPYHWGLYHWKFSVKNTDQSESQVFPGNSGAPVFQYVGRSMVPQVVGILSAGSSGITIVSTIKELAQTWGESTPFARDL